DDADRTDRRFEIAHDPAHLDCQAGQPVAESRQRQALEHQIGEPAIAGHLARALPGHEELVRLLVLGAAIEPYRQVGGVEWLAIGPDAADMGDLALAEAQREARDDLLVL